MRRNIYSSFEIDRASHEREDEEKLIELISSGEARFAPVDTEKNLVRRAGKPEAVFLSGMMARAIASSGAPTIFLGYVEGTPYFALDVTGMDAPIGELGEFTDLRQVGPLLFAREGSILAYARGMTYWHRRHKFCGVCGSPTKISKAGHERLCTNEACKAQHFPRTDPAVIMLVTHGDQCILGRGKHFPPGMHSTLAGFVEPGESFEDAVAREVYEEVRVKVKDVIYHSSQPWPFPASVMIGFRAEAISTDFEVNKDELDRAQWYHRDELQEARLPRDGSFFLPRKDSIARRLVDDWLANG
jgi:NAD+ diphosphatase